MEPTTSSTTTSATAVKTLDRVKRLNRRKPRTAKLSRSSTVSSTESVACANGNIDVDDVRGLSTLVSECLGNGAPGSLHPFLQPSLFPHFPPAIRFYTKGTKVSKPSNDVGARLLWCQNSLLPVVMRHTLSASHFRIVGEEAPGWIGFWGRHLKSAQYKNVKPYQKINHFPGAFHMGRKDRLWQHLKRAKGEHPQAFKKIMPTTYLLPADWGKLTVWLDRDPTNCVILKPPASARGTGIVITREPSDYITASEPMIAQQYIARPLVMDGTKFDLRLYAYIPSLEPLRVYIYNEGLVRFASVKYSTESASLSNKFMHLTNFSINKSAQAEGARDSPVPKWRLSRLWEELRSRGQCPDTVRRAIHDCILKAVLACESPIRAHAHHHLKEAWTCHELFGFDILLDADLHPWLLEVNISPSLHSATPLDASVKAPLAANVLNMAGLNVPQDPDNPHSEGCINYAAKPQRQLVTSVKHRDKAAWFEGCFESGDSDKWETQILSELTSEDVRVLAEFEDEYARRANFELLYPLHDVIETYLPMMTSPALYSNLLLAAWQRAYATVDDRQTGRRRLAELSAQLFHLLP